MEIVFGGNRSVGLEAVFVGEIYKRRLKNVANKNQLITDYGKLEIRRTGVLEQVELGHVQISCNSYFVDTAGTK